MQTRDTTPVQKNGPLGGPKPAPTAASPVAASGTAAVHGASNPAPVAGQTPSAAVKPAESGVAPGGAVQVPPSPTHNGAATGSVTPEGTPATPVDANAPKEPKEPREGQFMAQLRARETRLQTEKQAFAREQASFKAEREQLARDRQVVQTYAQREAIARQDPLAYLTRVIGWQPDHIAQRLMNGNKPAPDEGNRLMQAQLQQLTKSLEDERSARSAREQQELAQQQVEDFAKFAQEGKDKWPLAAKLAAEKKTRFLRLASSVVNASARKDLQDEEILDRLEEELSEITGTVSGKQPAGTRSAPPSTSGTGSSNPPSNAGSAQLSVDQRLANLKAQGLLNRRGRP